MQHLGNRIDLSQVKQQEGETLWSYLRRFFDKKATIVDATEHDVIDCFQNSLHDRRMFQDFGRRHPVDVKSLKIMVQTWAGEEDREIERFESNRNKGQNNNNKNNEQRNNKNRNDRPNNNNQNNSGGHNCKCKPDNTFTAILQSSKKGGGKNQDRPSFNELLKK